MNQLIEFCVKRLDIYIILRYLFATAALCLRVAPHLLRNRWAPGGIVLSDLSSTPPTSHCRGFGSENYSLKRVF